MNLSNLKYLDLNNTFNASFIRVTVLLIVLLVESITMAQEPTSEPESKSEEAHPLAKMLETAEYERKIAEANKLRAEAEAATSKAGLPSSTTTGLEGTVDATKDSGYYAELLAYQSIDTIAVEIARDAIKKSSSSSMIILGQVDLVAEAAFWNLINFKIDLVNIALEKSINRYPQLVDDTPLEVFQAIPLISAAPAILGSLADIAAFFKTNRSISGKTITINEQALKAAVAHQLNKQKPDLTIILPDLDISDKGLLFTKLKTLIKQRDTLITIKDDLTIKYDNRIKENAERLIRLRTKKDIQLKFIDNAIVGGNSTTKLEAELEIIELEIKKYSIHEIEKEKVIAPLEKDILAASELIAAITDKTADKLSPLESVATMEQIMRNPEANLLYLYIVSQGGEIETSQSAFSQGRVSYLGGAVISFILTDVSGTYKSSGNVQKFKTASFKRRKGATQL